ncbi:aminotransferase class III-fold pyridoxal phosphate-dependent enzyme, partial [Sulfurimonas sp.]|nr:aminotransferase class III-fold pyridoxal phosphate-dependent enzyme [Sulfurimonas sp.]
HILGHNNSIITDAIKTQVSKGILYTTNSNLAYEVCDLLQKCVPMIERVVFANTGSEATMRAARISRAYTNKKKIAIFSGAWHGGNELFLYDFDYGKDDEKTYHKSAGIPDEFKDMVVILPYNDEKAFEIIENNKDDLAMIIIEPSQGSNPRDDMQKYLQTLRTVTEMNNIILCFDEMITGFRVALGGAQEYYGISADLVTYGKTLGGGLPIGVVAGKAKIMDCIKGDEKKLPTFMGGTFSANPLTMATSKALLEYLLFNQHSIYTTLYKNAKTFKSCMNKYFQDNNLSVRVMGMNSMLRFIFTDYPIKSRQDRDKYEAEVELQEKVYKFLLEEEVFVNNNRIIFLSILHTEDIIQDMIKSCIDAFNTNYFKA